MVRDVLGHARESGQPPEWAVRHDHSPYDPSYQPALYLIRDGRDVLVSLYFHHYYHLRSPAGNRAIGKRVHEYFVHLLGPGYDLDAVQKNLPVFLSDVQRRPFGGIARRRRNGYFLPWPDHIANWYSREGVLQLRYEDLLEDCAGQLLRIAEYLGVADISDEVANRIAEENSFCALSRRTPGEEDRQSPLRKGIVGDWKNHFTYETGQLFEQIAGTTLRDLGYERDTSWFAGLPRCT